MVRRRTSRICIGGGATASRSSACAGCSQHSGRTCASSCSPSRAPGPAPHSVRPWRPTELQVSAPSQPRDYGAVSAPACVAPAWHFRGPKRPLFALQRVTARDVSPCGAGFSAPWVGRPTRAVVGSNPTGGSGTARLWRLVEVGEGWCREMPRRIAEWYGPKAVIPAVSRRGSPIRKAPCLARVS